MKRADATGDEKIVGPGDDMHILKLALANTAACLGDALATYNKLAGQEVFKNAEATPSATLAPKELSRRIALRVAEIPDRTSPDDQPEMMLVTPNELRNIVEDEVERALYVHGEVK